MPEAAPFRQLARRSLRVHALLIGVIALATLQAGLLLSTATQLLHSEQDKIEFHFRRLGGALQEHERFLRGWRVQDPNHPLQPGGPPVKGPVTYLPFAQLGVDPALHDSATLLGRRFTGFYSAFWAESRFPSPRCLLINTAGTAGILVPSTADDIGSARPPLPILQATLGYIKQLAPSASAQRGDVRWTGRELGPGNPRLISIARAPQDAAAWGGEEGSANAPAVACLLDVSRLDDHRQVLGESIYDQLSIIAPDGMQVYGPAVAAPRQAGREYTMRGLVYRMRTDAGWQVVYHVRWGRILSHPRGPLIGSVVLALLLAGGGTLLLRSYRRSVLQPLRANHERLLESEAFSRTVLDNAPIGLCLLRRRDGEVILDNAPARSWLGNSHEAPGWHSEWRAAAQTSLSTDHPDGQTFTTPGGRHLLVTATPARYRGEPVVLCLFVDLTAQHEAEQVLQQARVAADQANRAKSQFLATISHEIRTPLYGVLGTLELLGLTPLVPRQQEYLSTIQRSSATLMELISDILDVSKAEAGQLTLEPVVFNPATLTEDVLRSYAAAATRKHLQLYACIETSTDIKVVGDAARIRQVLNNLLSNAVKFTDAGRIVVRLTTLQQPGEPPRLHWQVADTGIGIAQEHHERLFEAFYQANPGTDALRGTGLGLAISAHLVGLMAGQLRVVSESGLGSSFSFALPLMHSRDAADPHPRFDSPQTLYVRSSARELAESLCGRIRQRGAHAVLFNVDNAESFDTHTPLLDIVLDEPVPEWAGPHVVAVTDGGDRTEFNQGRWIVGMHRLDAMVDALLQASGHGKLPNAVLPEPALRPLGLHVLIAEDNPINQTILREQLEQLGCHAVVAGDGDEALGYWDQRRFDAVLTDVNMPHMDGYALARALRGRGAQVPIIGATANAAPEERERCRVAGMNSCLVKPISLHALYLQLSPLAASVALDSSPGSDNAVCTLAVPAHLRSLFLTTMRDDLHALERATLEADTVQMRQMLHRIGGALVTVSAQRLVDQVTDIEDAIDAGAPVDQVVFATATFHHQLERALSQLEQHPPDDTLALS